MVSLVLQFFGAALIIIIAGTYLTRYADALGELLGLGATLAGMLLLAMATSLPELTVQCNLAYMGEVDLALGDLLGSSLLNLLILAMLDLVHRGPARMIASTGAAHTLSVILSIALTAICLLFLLLPIEVTFAGVGPGPVVILLAYLLGLRLVYFDQHYAKDKAGEIAEAIHPQAPQLTLRRAAVGYLVAALAILFAAPRLASAADGLATATSLGDTFVGTTLVAFATSAPELVTTFAAVRAGAFDLAVGNIFGSNTCNMTILIAGDFFYDGSILAAASSTHAITAACVIIVSSVAAMGLLYRAEKRYWLVEPDALLVILLVLGALGLVYYLA
jgi:cation:H+ antiporter